MKKLPFLLLIFVCALVDPGVAQTPAPVVHTPGPSYPPSALRANVTGTGTCQVVFNGLGRVDKATMTKSTGSKTLDENTLRFAREQWTGKPNTIISVPIVYQLAPKTKVQPQQGMLAHTPFPPYPYQARATKAQGNGIVKVTFDDSGRATSAVMEKSTGSKILDDNTVSFVLANWRSPGGKTKVLITHINYQYRWRTSFSVGL